MPPPDGLSGGKGLEAYLQGIADRLANASEVRVGFLEGSAEADGTSLPMVAAVQEFGSPAQGIPPRPFFRTMIADKSPAWGEQLGKMLDRHDYDAAAALRQMGEGISGQLVDSIDATVSPPLSPKTIARKGFEKPLIDSGTMRNTVGYEVT